jgi:hypothetical protein
MLALAVTRRADAAPFETEAARPLKARLALFVIPGHRAAMSLEPMNTDIEKTWSRPADLLEKIVFVGSGFALAGAPERQR